MSELPVQMDVSKGDLIRLTFGEVTLSLRVTQVDRAEAEPHVLSVSAELASLPVLADEDLKVDVFTRGDRWKSVRIVHTPTGSVGVAEGEQSRLRLMAEAMEKVRRQVAGRGDTPDRGQVPVAVSAGGTCTWSTP